MKTDKEIYRIFQQCPEMVYELAALKFPGQCQVTSVTLKDVERRLDGLVCPDDEDQPLIVFEVQFQRAEDIYPRILAEAALVQQENGMREVLAVIFFASRSQDPETEPWTKVVRRIYLDEHLALIEKSDPLSPLAAVFKPVFERDETKLEKEAALLYRLLLESTKYTLSQRESLSTVFLHWLMERFKTKTNKELAMILELPDIEQTRCGQDLLERGIERGIQFGREQGIEHSILVIARKRFGGAVDERVEKAIRDLDLTSAEQLVLDLLDIDSFELFCRRLPGLSEGDS